MLINEAAQLASEGKAVLWVVPKMRFQAEEALRAICECSPDFKASQSRVRAEHPSGGYVLITTDNRARWSAVGINWAATNSEDPEVKAFIR